MISTLARTHAVTMALLIAAATTAAAQPEPEPEQRTLTAPTVKGWINALQASATQWAADGQLTLPPPKPGQTTIAPTTTNLASIKAALSRKLAKTAMEELFITHRLLQPFRQGQPDDLKRLLPTLTRIDTRLQYKPMIKLGEKEIATLNPRHGAKLTPEMAARIDTLQRRKITRENAVIKHNVLVRKVKADVHVLRILADDRRADQAVVRAVTDGLKRSSATYTDALAAIETHVQKMSASRAKLFYNQLKALRRRTGDNAATFINPAGYKNGKTRNSDFLTEGRIASVDLVRTLNLLAGVARQPPVKAPATK